MNLQNATVFITGANRGIGRELVTQCLKAGARKVYCGVRDIASLEFDDVRIVPVHLDVSDAASINDAATLAGDCQLLINNAGVLDFGDVLQTTEAQFEKAFTVNTWGLLNMTRALELALQKNSGAVVNILTLLSLASMPGMAAYNASKAAAWSLTLSLRATLAAKNITVHSVFPGAVDTTMLAGVDIAKTAPQQVAEAIVQGVIEGREDIFPDPMSQQVYAAWRSDHKAVEKQFAAM